MQELGIKCEEDLIHGSGVKVIMEKLTLILIDSITERSILYELVGRTWNR